VIVRCWTGWYDKSQRNTVSREPLKMTGLETIFERLLRLAFGQYVFDGR